MPPQRHPSSLNAHLGFWMRFVSNSVSARFQRLLEMEGTTVTEWVALRALYDQKATTHAALIDALGMTKGAASKVISRLEEKGWAKREYAAAGSRDQAISLSRAGRLLVPKLAAHADENEEYFFGYLSQGEREHLADILKDFVTHHQLKELPLS